MREKRRAIDSRFLLRFEREKERTKESVEWTLSSVSCARVFVSVSCELFFRRSRERREKNLARKISRSNALMTRENETKTRTQSLNTSCSISTKTIPTASKPNAHKQTSTCTLGVFEIWSPRKAENAIRRRSKENIFVGLFLFLVVNAVNRVLHRCLIFPLLSVKLSRYIILYVIQSRRIHTEETKNITTPFARERDRDRQRERSRLSVVRWCVNK